MTPIASKIVYIKFLQSGNFFLEILNVIHIKNYLVVKITLGFISGASISNNSKIFQSGCSRFIEKLSVTRNRK